MWLKSNRDPQTFHVIVHNAGSSSMISGGSYHTREQHFIRSHTEKYAYRNRFEFVPIRAFFVRPQSDLDFPYFNILLNTPQNENQTVVIHKYSRVTNFEF